MDNNISKIAANANFFVQNKAVKKEQEEKKAEEKQPQTHAPKTEAKNPDAIFEAMQLSAMQNKAIAFGKFVNPKEYLSEERIADIEASMGSFENGVQKTKDAFDKEFENVGAWQKLPEATKFEMAAKLQDI